MYNLSPYVAEFYDATETQTHDTEWLLDLTRGIRARSVLEVYCGTGRITLPIAEAGVSVTGVDRSAFMLQRFRHRLHAAKVPARRAVLKQCDFLQYIGHPMYDVMMLVGNCLYNHGTPEAQQRAIENAAHLTRRGGHVILDNDVHEVLTEDWGTVGMERPCFPSGRCQDGTELRATGLPTTIDPRARFPSSVWKLQIVRGGAVVERYEWVHETHAVYEMFPLQRAASAAVNADSTPVIQSCMRGASNVLDLGCGNGWRLRENCCLFSRGVALDASEYALRVARGEAASAGVRNVAFVRARRFLTLSRSLVRLRLL